MHFTLRSLPASLIIALLAGTGASSWAAGLGAPELRSHLGEPLRLVVPLRISAGEGFSDDCVRVIPSRENDGVPPVYGARARVVRGSERNEVVVTTSEPMQEPIIRVVVEVGCTASVSRDFVMLLDPPVNVGSTLPGAVEAVDPAARPATTAPRRAQPPRTSTADASEPAARPRIARAPRTSAPAASPSSSTPSGTVPGSAARPPSAAVVTPAPAPRLRLEDPAALAGATRPPSTSSDAPGAVPSAPLAATPPPVPQPTAQEVELINKLTALGEQIELLKRQVAEQSALNAQLRDQQQQTVPLNWLYALLAFAVIALLVALRMAYQMRRMRQAVPTHAWWAETRLRSDPATIMKAGTAAAPPSAQGPPTLMPGMGPVVSQADAEQEVFYPNGTRTDPAVRLEARFARQTDSRIEVEELGATQAMKVLGETNVQMAITQGFDTAVRASAAAQPGGEKTEAIHSLDFDLGEPVLTTPSVGTPVVVTGEGSSAGIASVDFPIGDAAPAAPILAESSQFVPPIAGAGNAGPMSWIEARQVQTYLRQTADAIEQADAYLSAGQSESAASVLRRLIQDKEGTPRAPWLMLLHIYRRTDKREAYEGLAAKFATQFGRTPPPWDLVSLNPIEPGLDSDPQLLQAIWAKWGSADSMTLLSQLLYDREAGDEAFFNLTLQRDLLNFVKICPLEES
ncbi:hypothetical protein BH10PSE17_BH10PSE17_36190 [soil metagenome]